jgi:23S rRNA pseudouridine1911/1915/1917 synthase
VKTRLELTTAPEDAGLRLDALLARQEAVGSRAAAQRLIEAGAVEVDGAGAAKSRRVSAGQRIVAVIEDQPAPARDPAAAPEVVFEDEHLLVVDKPAGLVVHPARGHRGPTLVEALADRLGGGADPERPGVVHRLDRDTSGLLVLARSDEAHAALQRLVRRRAMHRQYLTLVAGGPDADSGTIDAPLGRDRVKRTVVSTRSDRGRTAVTHFSVLERLARTTLMEVRLETGRTHQIRAHLAAIGHPVCGDARYGGENCGRALELDRQFLHSSRLMFMHPITGEETTCESKPPADLRRALDAARQEPVSGGPDGD